jgi:hypothetical protein
MRPICAPCELGILARRSDAEQRFQKVRYDLTHDEHGVYKQLDLLRLEGDMALCVRLHGGDWLELELDQWASETGIGWVTYHAANITDAAARVVIPTSCPSLWWAAAQYLGRAMHILDVHRRRAVQ